MIELTRKKDEKWIFQKNISSSDLLKTYAAVLVDNQIVDKEQLLAKMKQTGKYKGRSDKGSISCMGVRFSQMCFYMFGYQSSKNVFMESETTKNILQKNADIGKNMLVNLFAIQYPHPYSNTPSIFRIHAGRLIIKLLCENKIGRKLYIDEMIWFLPFIRTIDEEKYNQLVDSILEFRNLNYYEKLDLMRKVDNYENLFANCLHEFKYYFAKIFEGFEVFNLIEEPEHNDGLIFKFKHAENTYRTDAIGKNQKSGYVKLKDNLIESAEALLTHFKFDKVPLCLDDPSVHGKQEWITDLYETEIIDYLRVVLPQKYEPYKEILDVLDNMKWMSKYSSVDGKDFERSLEPVFKLFDRVIDASIISGSGDTDLLCVIDAGDNTEYKINVDAKSRGSVNNMNVMRLLRHLKIHNSKYCIVVAPRFCAGVKLDVQGQNIVLITADALATYCSKECLDERNKGVAHFDRISSIISNNMGTDITTLVLKDVENRYGIAI